MQSSKVEHYRVPFWIGPLRIGSWSFDLDIEVLEPVIDGELELSYPLPNRLSAGSDGVLRCAEPLTAIPSDKRYALIRYELSRYDRQMVSLQGSMADYLAGFSSKTRSTLRRKVRRFEKAAGGTADVREYKTPEEIELFFQIARRVSKQTYQERLYNKGLPEDQGYIERMKALAEKDSVRAWLLFLEDDPISYLFCPATAGRLHYEFLGFLPKHSKLSPGTVLQMFAMEALFEEQRFLFFDFSEGTGKHKRLFGNISVPCANALYLRRSVNSYVFLTLHKATTTFSEFLVNLTERAGIKSRLRKLLRRQSG